MSLSSNLISATAYYRSEQINKGPVGEAKRNKENKPRSKHENIIRYTRRKKKEVVVCVKTPPPTHTHTNTYNALRRVTFFHDLKKKKHQQNKNRTSIVPTLL